MTDLNAAERLEFDRERDPTPVDEAFARSVAVESGEHRVDGPLKRWWHIPATNWTGSNSVTIECCAPGVWMLRVGEFEAYNPTIGDFYTACRLFKVQLKEGV